MYKEDKGIFIATDIFMQSVFSSRIVLKILGIVYIHVLIVCALLTQEILCASWLLEIKKGECFLSNIS